VNDDDKERITFAFSHIDPRNVAKEYRVSIQRTAGSPAVFTALAASPEFPSFASLAAAFDLNHDLQTFIRAVRAGFKSLVQPIQQ
jgi:hypothetical protein